MTSYYNEIDPYAAQWLRNLIIAGLIAPGHVDERSIADVTASDLDGYAQCHFFAGIGGWSRALRLAEWPDDRPVWTGSCPCQPFSEAGERGGIADERHMWPELFRLIAKRRPNVVFGEQVSQGGGLAWLDCVRADLETIDYPIGALDLSAAGIGSPHARQRLYWVSHAPSREARYSNPGWRSSEFGEQQPEDAAQAGRSTRNGSRGIRLSEPPVCGVVNGFPGIVEQNSAYGNAIQCDLAAEFIRAAQWVLTG